MVRLLDNMFEKKVTERLSSEDEELRTLRIRLKKDIQKIFGRSISIREVDCGSDNAAEIELNNLSTPYYDIERFGIGFVASPRHADILIVTGSVTHNMENALKKVYEATPNPKWVIAVGDDACDGGIFRNTYAVNNGVEDIIPVDMKIPGNPPTPTEIIKGLLYLMEKIRAQKKKT